MRARPFSRVLPALLAGLMFAHSALAWNDTGHKTVALIAWQDLTPETRAAITAILLKHPQYSTLIQSKEDAAAAADAPLLDFMTAATWPDLIRAAKPENRQYQHSDWHYTDFPFIDDSFVGDKPEVPPTEWHTGQEPTNLLMALQKVEADLNDPKTTDAQKAVALAWVEHLVGDIHQPLHATSWFSKEFPAGDKGGNSVIINAGEKPENLHAYWDGLLGKYENLKISREVALQIVKDHPRSEFAKELKDGVFKDWAQESFEQSKTVVYMKGAIPHLSADEQKADKTKPVPPLPQEYIDQARELGRKKIALAGYRLADQLNAMSWGTKAGAAAVGSVSASAAQVAIAVAPFDPHAGDATVVTTEVVIVLCIFAGGVALFSIMFLKRQSAK